METKNYIEINLVFKNHLLSQVEEIKKVALSSLNCDGIEEFAMEEEEVDRLLGSRSYSGGDIPLEVLDEIEGIKLAQEWIRFKFFFYGDNIEERSQKFYSFVENKRLAPDLKIELYQRAEQDWNQVWKAHYEKIVVHPQLLTIVPSWEKSESDQEKVNEDLYIYPGQGFGTGSHETTFLCLQHLCDLQEQNAFIAQEKEGRELTCLDFGCGSGILGLAAMKLAFSKVYFYDIDQEALINTQQNLDLNPEISKLGEAILVHHSQRGKIKQKYQLVFANILMNILKDERKALQESVNVGGYLILSGLLHQQADEIIVDYTKDSRFCLLGQKRKNDWISLLFKMECE